MKIKAIFDSLSFIVLQQPNPKWDAFIQKDFIQVKNFLLSYQNNTATFSAYRRETERLLQWAWHIHQRSIRDLRRQDIELYIQFCQNPPLAWIGTQKKPRFLGSAKNRIPNQNWYPFVATVPKAAHRKGYIPNPKHYRLSAKSLREIFTITSSLYHFLIREEYTLINPVAHIRQKSHYFQTYQSKQKVRRLTELQWDYVLHTAEKMAVDGQKVHERALFIITILYSLYLRVSELSANIRWTPKMSDFARDQDGLWWFTTVGKNNKERQISVSNALLEALGRYRLSLGLPRLPTPYEQVPLIPKIHGKGPICSTSQIRVIVQNCFNAAILQFREEGLSEEAISLENATAHWLRHTGISDDIKHRPREHVRDDAGHSSSMVTDRYINVEQRARHQSSRNKKIKPLL